MPSQSPVKGKPMISKVELANLPPFKNVTIDFTPGFNVITGANGAGKSVLLNTISHVLFCLDANRPPSLNNAYVLLHLTAPVSRIVDTRQVPHPNAQKDWYFDGFLHRFTPIDGKPVLVSISPIRGGLNFQQQGTPISLGDWRAKSTAERFAALRVLLRHIQNVNERDYLDDHLKKRLEQHFTLNEKCLINMRRSRDTAQIVLTDVASLGQHHELGGAASGCQELLFIVAETLTIKKSLVIIDEPELHLHPKAQDLLAKYLHFLTTPDGGSNQVIVATHSLSFIYGHDNARVINLAQGNSGNTAEIIVDKNRATPQYAQALENLGYSADAFLNAIRFHKGQNIEHPVWTTRGLWELD